MQRIAVVGDTHIPSRATELPDWVETEVEDADLAIHAGDFDSLDAFEKLRDLADELVAVYGNMDPRSVDASTRATVWVEDVQFVVVHGHRGSGSYDERVARTVREERDTPDAVGVSGHTHELRDDTVDGIRLLNPGSATGVAPAEAASMLAVDVDGESLEVTERWE